MKKLGILICCVFLCWVVGMICLPEVVTSNPMVDSTGCTVCHDATLGGDLHTTHTNCADCHDGTPAKGNVSSSACLACHPAVDSELCDLVNFHEDSTAYDPVGASCLVCHDDCETGDTTTTTSSVQPTTTTTAAVSTTTTIIEICPAEEIYGENSIEVAILRYVRDNVLSTTPEGQEIIKLYYQLSPVILMAIQNDEAFKAEVKEAIDGVLQLL